MRLILEIIMYLFSALGGIVAIWTIWLWLRPFKRIRWRKVEKGIKQLKEDLIQSNYYPTLIVGIGRGGAVIGALLSGTLGNVPIIVIDRVYDWTSKERKEGFCEEIRISKNITKVLLVAGELHSGNTAKKYTEYFNDMGAKEIRMLTFMKEPYPTFKPDFSYLETDKSDIRFPWMITNDYKRESKMDYNAK
jgi:probable phosphoglycerate mutase